MDIHRFENRDRLDEGAARHVAEVAGRAVRERGRFCLALSGGSTPVGVYRRLSRAPYAPGLDWENIHLFWGDERMVPHDHEHSNMAMVRKTGLLDRVPAENIHPVPVGRDLDPVRAAREYDRLLGDFFQGPPCFDLCLLGMGPDGHTASLFPGHPSLALADAWAAPESEPGTEPRVPRVTLTLPALNASREVLFLVAGKDEMVRNVLEEAEAGNPSLPAAMVRPKSENLFWYVS